MAAVGHQLRDLESARSSELELGQSTLQPKNNVRQYPSYLLDARTNKRSPQQYAGISEESLQGNCCHSFSRIAEEPTRMALSLDNSKKTSHGKASPNLDTAASFVASLKACAKTRDLPRGILLHNDIQKAGFLPQCLDDLVIMYAKCGVFARAKELLDVHNGRDVVTWTALISEYAHQGQGMEALQCFEQMHHEGLCPDGVTYVCILKVCGSIGALPKGEQIHLEIASQGLLGKDDVLGATLVDMYAKCGAFSKAEQVLAALHSRDVVAWNALIAGYSQQGKGEQALKSFRQMRSENICPNPVTFACVLKACASIRAVDKGEQIHDEITKLGLLGINAVLGTALVDMYAKCGFFTKAEQLLEECFARDVITWNALMVGYVQQGQGVQALNCFERMLYEGFSPNATTFTCVLKACGILKAAVTGEQIHDEIARQFLLRNNLVLSSALVDFYTKCGLLTKAQQVLEELSSHDSITWNALIAGYSRHGQDEQALSCYRQMQHEGFSPNAVTFACILKTCGSLGAFEVVEQIHDEIARQKLLENNIVLSTALIDVYAKCNALERAEQVLAHLPLREVSAWNALITGYVQDGQGEQALSCFERMQKEGISPDSVTFACILKACGSIGAAGKGEEVCDEITRKGMLKHNSILGTAMVDMYGKCGAVGKASQVLKELPSRDAAAWSALIAGYAKQGQIDHVLYCFEEMQREGLSPNAATLSSVLSACSHSGLVDDGLLYFSNMGAQYGVKLDWEHYACMVDLLGRAGHLDKAVGLMQEIPVSAYLGACSALLGACQKWRDVNVGQWAFERALPMERCEWADYVLMSNLYAAAGMQEDALNFTGLKLEKKAWDCAAGRLL